MRQTTGGLNDLLATYANYAQHRPQTVTDAAGQTTTLTYNAAGQVLTVTNAKNETTTNTYDTEGRLTTVTGPVSGATTTYTYDGYGRMRTVTDADNATVTTDYDLWTGQSGSRIQTRRTKRRRTCGWTSRAGAIGSGG